MSPRHLWPPPCNLTIEFALDSSGFREQVSPVAGSTSSEMNAVAEFLPHHTFRKPRTGVCV